MNSKLKSLRLAAYRRMNFEDPEQDDSVQSLHRMWDESAEAVRYCTRCLNNTASLSPNDEAEFLLTILVCQQATIRDYALLDQTIDRAFNLLPRITDDRLRLHLLVQLFAETEDDAFHDDIETLLPVFLPFYEEDLYLLQYYRGIVKVGS